MSRSSLTFTAPALEWRVDPGQRPALGERRDGRPIGALTFAIGGLWLAVAVRALLGSAPFPIAELGRGGAWASLGFGIALVLWGLQILVRRQTIRIDGDRIEVAVRGIAGTTAWREPLANYRGVLWRSAPIRRRHAGQTLHRVDLWHEDRSRTVTLLTSTSEVAAREAWQAWAQGLGLAALRWRAGEQEVVANQAAKPLASPQ